MRCIQIVRVGCAIVLVVLASAASGAAAHISCIALGRSTVALNGPWNFRTGDASNRRDPGLDDSSWETVDLTPLRGARDNDVGLPGYVAGWQARGHQGYYGYAWYRQRLAVAAPAGEPLAIAGPLAVDSAYQLYVNGRLLGGVGDFSGSPPTAYSMHRPTLFILPPEIGTAGTIVLAIRVWLGQWPRGPDAGGMHVAPVIGTLEAIKDQYRLEWLTLVEGYVVDAVEGLLLLVLALMALSIRPLDRADSPCLWIAAAAFFLGVHRGNQAVMFLGNFETMHEFELFILVLAIPLYTGGWVLAWRAWLRLRSPVWAGNAVVALTVAYMLAAFACRSWFRGILPDLVFAGAPYTIAFLRWALLLLYVLTAYQGVRERGREGWYAAGLMGILAVGIFGGELHYLGTPGIWFPFGVGVSLSECAYAVFVPLMMALLVKPLWAEAHRFRTVETCD